MRRKRKLKNAVQKFWAVMLVLSIMLTGIPSVTAFAAEEEATYTDIDDSVTTTTGELFKIQYEPSSRWHAESGYMDLFFDGTDHYSDKGSNEDYYEMKFIGTAIEIYGSKNTAHADCDVYIDDEYAGEVLSGLDSGATVHKQKLFEVGWSLEDEEHTLKVVRKSGDTRALQVDKIRIYHGELKATAITLSAENVKLGIGGTKKVEIAASEPWVVENPEVEWTSADESIATVDENGLITAVSTADEKKETVITATVKGTDVTASVKVTVDPQAESMVVGIGDEKLLDTQLDYEELVDKNLADSWSGTAWKGDTLNSKVIVLAQETDVHNLTVTASDFENEAGDVLASENISIKWLKEILAKEGRNMAGSLNSYPDIIHKGGATDVDAESVKFAWVSMEIPEDTEAGIYTGTITVNANELKKPVEFTYTIEVLDLVQPAPEATEIQIWQHPFSVANYYLGLGAQQQPGGVSNELDEDFYFTEQHFNLMRDATLDYVSMGGHDWVANIVEEAWNHQSYYNDLSMVKWTKKTDGSWEFDYTWYDAWIEFGIECGVIDPETELGQIKCYSIVPWNNQVTYYDEASGETAKESHTPGADAWTAIWTPFLEDFMAHSKEKGWFDITYISMDERTIAQLEPTVDLIESITDENGNSFKISSALNYAAPEYYDFTDRIHDISINLGHCSNQTQMNELAEHRRELGLKTTMYTCTGNYPSNFTISDPGDNYWQIWYTMTLSMDGFLRWAWDNYVYDMHGNITYRYWEPGDGWYIYPIERDEVGENYEAGFYSTPRYELFKQGIRDVAKAKYLMEQSDVIAQEIDELMGTLSHPSSGTVNGSAAPSSEAQRLSLHAETDRIYEKVTAWAKAYIENPENPELPKGANEDDSNDYPVEKLTATAGSEQASAAGDGEGLAEFVLDGDPTTHHHSAWNPLASEDQLWIMLELEEPEKIEALRYLPRTGRDNGSVTQYEISYSMDGENWEIISTGTWPLNKEWKLAEFDEAVEAKYIKLYAVDSVADEVGRHLSAAEIRLVVAKDEEPVDPPVVEEDEVARISGKTRYETGYKVADALKEALGVEKFEAVVVATGKNFADALAGSYLAVQKNAPIILTNGKDDNIAQLHEYIAANVAEGGKVYILGGEGAVPAAVEAIEGYDVVRLAGKSRYETNLAILAEAGIAGDEVIVATGKSFADSLSASAAKLPILLVKPGTALSDEAKAIAEERSKFYIIGGEGAVSADVAAELAAYGEVVRVAGKTRYETSVAVANTFFADVEKSVVASGKNFPDGLCGGPLAAAMNAPLILTADGKTEAAVDYMADNTVASGFVLGGTGALADESVVDVFALESADEIKTSNNEDAFVGVFWYTLSDNYLSAVKTTLDDELTKMGLEAEKNFVHYDSNRDQETQTEQIDAAIQMGATCLVVNIAEARSAEVSQLIVDKAAAAGIPVIFFNRVIGVDGSDQIVLESYDKCAYVGADAPEAARLQGAKVGEYLTVNYDEVDLNGDGKISYAMFMGQAGNEEAMIRTQYSVEDANKVLTEAGKPELEYFDPANTDCYQADPQGRWSAEAAQTYMQTNLSQYNEANDNMIELVICNNDGMAEGAILALQDVGYNQEGATVIPVFGIDGTDTAKDFIDQGIMTCTIEHDPEGVAVCIADLVGNVNAGRNLMDGTEGYNIAEGFTNKIFIPYLAYTAE